MADPDYGALADAVVSRRKLLNLKQADLRARGGPHQRTLVRIESRWYETANADVSSATLDSLDVSLRWVPGSAARTLMSGAAPVPLETATDSADQDRLAQFRAWHQTLERIGDHIERGIDVDAVTDDLRRITAEVGRVVDATEHAELQRRRDAQAEAFTGILEKLRRDGDTLSGVMETAFSEYLHPSVDGSVKDDDDVYYRLWLLGRFSATDEQAKAFERRFAHSATQTQGEPRDEDR